MNEIHQIAKQLYNKLHPSHGVLGTMGPPGCSDKGSPYWDTAGRDENRMLIESIYGLQLCLNTLRSQWEQLNQDLPHETITCEVASPIGMSTHELEIKLIPHNVLPDWQPHSKGVGVGFRVETTDGRYEIDGYPENPVAYPK